MKVIKLFLASSSELLSERMEIAALLTNFNNALRKHDIFIQLVKWEYVDASVSSTHDIKQGDYNDELEKCDLCMVLFWKRFGMYTAEETELGKNSSEYIFFKETSAPTGELLEFKNRLMAMGREFDDFSNIEELKVVFIHRIITWLEEKYQVELNINLEETGLVVEDYVIADLEGCRQEFKGIIKPNGHNDSPNGELQKNNDEIEVTIFFTSTYDLNAEYLTISDLAANLNLSFSKKKIKIYVKKWESINQNHLLSQLKGSDILLALYWQKFGFLKKEGFDQAYREMKEGRNPSKIFVYFKDGGDNQNEIEHFKNSFVDLYGHFFCRFANTDSLKAEFVLQILNYVNECGVGENLVNLQSSQVVANGELLFDLKNVPFLSNNEDYNMLCSSIKKTKKLIAVTEEDDPDLIDYSRELEDLEKRKKEFEIDVWQTALLITKLSSKESSERLSRAIECFRKGDNKGANAILKEDEIERDGRSNILKIQIGEEGKKGLKTNIDELMLKVKTLFVDKPDNWWTSVESLYKKAIEWGSHCLTDKDLGGLCYELARFSNEQKKYHEAIKYYKQSISLKTKAGLEQQVAKVKLYLAIACRESTLFEDALGTLKEIETYFRSKTDDEDEENSEYLSRVLHETSVLYNHLGNSTEAKKYHSASLSIMKEVANKSKEAVNIVNLAVAYVTEVVNNKDLKGEQIEDLYKESNRLFRTLSEKDYQKYIDSYAGVICVYARCFFSEGKIDLAEQLYSEALSIFKELAAKNPNRYLGEVASVLLSKGKSYFSSEEYNNAITVLNEARIIFRNMVDHKSYLYCYEMAWVCNLMGKSYHNLSDTETAEAFYNEAEELLRELKGKDRSYSKNHAQQLYVNSLAHNDMEKYGLAEKEIEESISIMETFPESNKKNQILLDYEIQHSKVLGLMGEIDNQRTVFERVEHYINLLKNAELSKKQRAALSTAISRYGRLLYDVDISKSTQRFKESFLIFEELIETEAFSYAEEKEIAGNYASALIEQGFQKDAILVYKRLIEASTHYSNQPCDDYAKDIAYYYNEIGRLYAELKEYDKASQAYWESLNRKKEIANNILDYEFEQAKTLNNIANLYKQKMQYEQSEIFHKQAIAIKTRFFDMNPEKYMKSLVISYRNLGDLYIEMNRLDDALEIYQKGCNISAADLSVIFRMGYVYELLNDKERSETYYKQTGLKPSEIEEQKGKMNRGG